MTNHDKLRRAGRAFARGFERAGLAISPMAYAEAEMAHREISERQAEEMINQPMPRRDLAGDGYWPPGWQPKPTEDFPLLRAHLPRVPVPPPAKPRCTSCGCCPHEHEYKDHRFSADARMDAATIADAVKLDDFPWVSPS